MFWPPGEVLPVTSGLQVVPLLLSHADLENLPCAVVPQFTFWTATRPRTSTSSAPDRIRATAGAAPPTEKRGDLPESTDLSPSMKATIAATYSSWLTTSRLATRPPCEKANL